MKKLLQVWLCVFIFVGLGTHLLEAREWGEKPAQWAQDLNNLKKPFFDAIDDLQYAFRDEVRYASSAIGLLTVGLTMWTFYQLIIQLQNLANQKYCTIIPADQIKMTFADIVGLDDVKGFVLKQVDYFDKIDLFTKHRFAPPKGILLYGPPGNGKSSFARAVAGELGYPMVHSSGGSFQTQDIGISTARLRDLFKQARDNAPCVLCIDEIDALIPVRDSKTGNSASNEDIILINTFLTELDALNVGATKPVIFIATTNRRHAIDPAAMRPGRLEQVAYVGMPDYDVKKQILTNALQSADHADDIDFDKLTSLTAGFSCVDCAEWVKQSLLEALQDGRTEIEFADFVATKNSFGAYRYPLSVGQVFSPNQIQASFDTIFGAQDAKLALQEVIDIFNNHAQYAQYHIAMPNGILLHGPSGNGKTMLAKAFAGQAGMSFIYVNAAEFESAGHGVDRVKELFEAARQFAPCAVFIDGIDSVGARMKDSGNSKNAMVNQLLAELDGFLGKDPKKPMTVIAATNNLEVLDPALLRPGRFDKIVYVGNPTEQDRQNILQAGCADKPCDQIDFAFLAKQSEGLSAAQVQNWIVQTNTVAAKKRSMITTDLFMQIFDQIK